MKNLFPAYYPLDDNTIDEAWLHGMLVLDTNILLNFYRYPQKAREDFFAILEQVSDRIWIPHQVALEYQINRPSVISEQINRFDDVKKVVNTALSDINKKFSDFQLSKRHSSIDPNSFMNDLQSIFDNFNNHLDELKDNQPDIYSEDLIRMRIDAILASRVGDQPENQKFLDDIYNEGKKRYESKIPPGYKDSGKSKEDDRRNPVYMHNNLHYKREYGDLLIWHQIIEKAKILENKKVIFISDDDKEDWILFGSRGKRIGTRPELIEEIRIKSDVEVFFISKSNRLIESLSRLLNITIENTSIKQIEDISIVLRESNREFFDKNLALSLSELQGWIDDEEEGFFDTFSEMESNMDQLTAITNDITADIINIGERMDEGTADIENIKNTSGNKGILSKRVVDRIGGYLSDFANSIEDKISPFSYQSKRTVESITKIGAIAKNENNPAGSSTIINTISSFKESCLKARNSIANFRDTTKSFKGPTRVFAQAQEKAYNALDMLVRELDNLYSLCSEVERYMRSSGDDEDGSQMLLS